MTSSPLRGEECDEGEKEVSSLREPAPMQIGGEGYRVRSEVGSKSIIKCQ